MLRLMAFRSSGQREECSADSAGVMGLYCQGDVISTKRGRFAEMSHFMLITALEGGSVSAMHAHCTQPICPSLAVETVSGHCGIL